jgi:hypothetical protein
MRALGVSGRRSVAAVVVVLLAGAGTAVAARAPTAAEQEGAAAVAGVPAACVDVTVSTVDPTWLAYRGTGADGCPDAEAQVVAHRSGNAWSRVTEVEDQGLCPVDGVPDAVARDLRLCVAPSRKVYLARPVSTKVTVSSLRPPTVWVRDRAYAKKVRWERWGKPTATGRGRLDYYAGQRFHADVRLTVSRVALCGERRRTYTRISLRFVHAADRRKHGWLETTRTLPCPVSAG